jgi:polyisoprenoid-binding protein YceI
VYESKIEIASFLHGSTFLGIFIGVGISLWFGKLKSTKELSILKRIIHFIIPLTLISALIFLEILKEHVGGLSAFVGIIIGLILKDKQQQKTSLLALISISFGIILMSIPFLQPEQIKEKKNDKIMLLTDNSDKKEEVITPFDLPGKKLSEISDSWKINSDNSKIDFELGPKDARTKGMFKIITGVFDIEKQIGNSNLNVTIPMTGFSTFNSFRDDGLKGSDYFDVAKFPNLTFKSKLIKELNDKYLVNGIFEMKGIKEEFELDLKLIEFGTDKKGEFAILVGKSNLNRSKFGMKSDPKIGDLVDFTFELELRK